MDTIKNYYKNHPKTFYAAVSLLALTVVIIVIFGANSALFQGNIGGVIGGADQLAVLPGKIDRLTAGVEGSTTTSEESDAEPAAGVDIADSDIIAESDTAAPTTSGGSRFSFDPNSVTTTLTPNENIGATANINNVDLGQIDNNLSGLVSDNSNQQESNTNTPPVVDGVTITVNGELKAGSSLTGNYDYFDADVDSENGTTFRWLIANSIDGAFTPTGATTRNYQITDSDNGKFLIFEVTPKNTVSTGTAVKSSAVGPILAQLSQPPTATNVRIIGDPVVGSTLLGAYQYSDPEGDPEIGSVLKWLKVNNGQRTVIATDTDVYQIKAEDVGSQIVFSYQPRNAVAETTGAETMSAPTGQITAAATTNNDNAASTTNEDVVGQDNTNNDQPQAGTTVEEDILNEKVDEPLVQTPNGNQEQQSLPQQATNTNTTNVAQQSQANNGNASFNLNSNTNANLLSAANVPGNTGPEALFIFPALGLIGLGLGRKLAKKK